jgi:hypothetical protein
MKKKGPFSHLPTKNFTTICTLTKRVKGKVTRESVCVCRAGGGGRGPQ